MQKKKIIQKTRTKKQWINNQLTMNYSKEKS